MLYAMLTASTTLILVLAVPRVAEARRLARLFRFQEEWAEMMDRYDRPLQRKDPVQAMVRRRGEDFPHRSIQPGQDGGSEICQADLKFRKEYVWVHPLRVCPLSSAGTPVLDPWSWYLSTQSVAPDH